MHVTEKYVNVSKIRLHQIKFQHLNRHRHKNNCYGPNLPVSKINLCTTLKIFSFSSSLISSLPDNNVCILYIGSVEMVCVLMSL